MDLNHTPLFIGITRRLDWLGQRTRVLAQNMANANTPGYEAQDLQQPSFRDLLRGTSSGMAMTRTDPGHLAGGVGHSSAADTKSTKEPFTATPTGNTVVLEEQMMKLAETQLDHQLTLNLYRKNIGLLQTALGRGR